MKKFSKLIILINCAILSGCGGGGGGGGSGSSNCSQSITVSPSGTVNVIVGQNQTFDVYGNCAFSSFNTTTSLVGDTQIGCNTVGSDGTHMSCDVSNDTVQAGGGLTFSDGSASASVTVNITTALMTQLMTNVASTNSNHPRVAEIKLTNIKQAPIQLNSFESALSDVTMIQDKDGSYANTCQWQSSLAPGASCQFWLAANPAAQLGQQHGNATIHYSVNGKPGRQVLGLNLATDLYVAGQFNHVSDGVKGAQAVSNIAKWNGQNWQVLPGANQAVTALASDDQGHVYAAGNFSQVNNIAASHIAMWNGDVWSALGAGFTATPTAINAKNNQQVYAILPATNSVQLWDGKAWQSQAMNSQNNLTTAMQQQSQVATQFGQPINTAVTDSHGQQFVGGAFVKPFAYAAQFIDQEWLAMPGLNGSVKQLALSNNQIFAAGAFTQPAKNLAVWSEQNQNWQALPNNATVDGSVNSILVVPQLTVALK